MTNACLCSPVAAQPVGGRRSFFASELPSTMRGALCQLKISGRLHFCHQDTTSAVPKWNLFITPSSRDAEPLIPMTLDSILSRMSLFLVTFGHVSPLRILILTEERQLKWKDTCLFFALPATLEQFSCSFCVPTKWKKLHDETT